MKFAIEGCAHGELNKIYECIEHIEQRENIKIDLLICCGDFQSVRDRVDLSSMAVPDKYMQMKDFWEYYTGERIAPVLTIFIGGNHEASSYLWELPYGGWVAPNIYYMGYAGVVSFAGIRIGGLSGIFKQHDYLKDHFEVPPFDNSTKRSFYHVRKRDVERLKLLKDKPPHVMLSHDWPSHIYDHGNKEQLMRFKPFLRDDIENNELGNSGAEEILHCVQPPYWFSGHMHAKFAALVNHPNGLSTKFLALDKCLPKRKFLQVLDMGEAKGESVLLYDLYWLGILKMTNELSRFVELSSEHVPTQQVLERMENCCANLEVLPFSRSINGQNPQTKEFCERFGVKNPCQRTTWKTIKETSHAGEDDASMSVNDPPPPPTSTPRRKMVLPTPGTGDTTVRTNTSSVGSNISRQDEDEFGELTNPSSLSLGMDDMSSSSSSNEDSGSSSSSASDNDNESDDDDYDDDDVTGKPSFHDPPSFIETPISKTSASTPLKKDSAEPGVSDSKLDRKELVFGLTPDKVSKDKLELESVSLTEKTRETKTAGKSLIATSDYGSDGSSKENTTGGETDQGEKGTSHTPVKKFKLVRRNQSIYTPKKEEDG